ncbi:helix-turn-helix domain-containing protein [Saccharopolyspora shandongensis]|uniref:helix-turn-helix domain-containing protein n=1 Tax=Saccharopolyspora shandongensis TaxID=418495 RepID=UPI0034352601
MIRAARRQARLSQTDLARRSGVAQSVISAYEADRREPSLHMLVKLIEATGHALSIELVSPPVNCLGLPDTRLGRRLRRNRRAVLGMADRRGAHNVRVFGSVARGQDNTASDIDLLVDLDDGVGLVSLAGLQRELAELLGVDVDVVPASSLKPAIRDEVMAEAIEL